MSLRKRRYFSEGIPPSTNEAAAIRHAVSKFSDGMSEEDVRNMVKKYYGRNKKFVDLVIKKAKVHLKQLKRMGGR